MMCIRYTERMQRGEIELQKVFEQPGTESQMRLLVMLARVSDGSRNLFVRYAYR